MLIQIPKAQNYYLGLSLFHENPKEKLWKFWLGGYLNFSSPSLGFMGGLANWLVVLMAYKNGRVSCAENLNIQEGLTPKNSNSH